MLLQKIILLTASLFLKGLKSYRIFSLLLKSESNYLHQKKNKIYKKIKLYNEEQPEFNKWDNVIPSLGNALSWKIDGNGMKDDPDQLFITKQGIMMFLASLLIILAFTIGYDKRKKVQSGF